MPQPNNEHAMTIKVLYFASLKETFGCSGQQLDSNKVNTVGDVWRLVSEGHTFNQSVLHSVNQEYAELDTLVKTGDEVAFFPPVTGG